MWSFLQMCSQPHALTSEEPSIWTTWTSFAEFCANTSLCIEIMMSQVLPEWRLLDRFWVSSWPFPLLGVEAQTCGWPRPSIWSITEFHLKSLASWHFIPAPNWDSEIDCKPLGVKSVSAHRQILVPKHLFHLLSNIL